MQRLCTTLSEHGYAISLICRHSGGIPESEFPQGTNFFQLSSTSMMIKLLEIHSYLRDINPDIVHLHYLAKDAIIPALKLNRKYKYIISIWGSDLNIFSRNPVNRVIQQFALRLCNKVHLNNSIYKSKISKLYSIRKFKKFSVITWGIDNGFIETRKNSSAGQFLKSLNINPHNKLILSYRNHKSIYNHRTLILAMPEIIRKYPETRFLFTRGSCDQKYVHANHELVNQYKLQNHFIYIDRWLSTEDLIQLVKSVDINVNIPLADGLPATLFEIMTSPAVPVVGKLDNYLDFFRENENGFYLNDLTSHEELAGIIIKILGALDQYKEKFFATNFSYVKEFQNWNIQSKQFLNLYNSLE
jgi:glycosyltransferase involved in cell wall biosynthesis